MKRLLSLAIVCIALVLQTAPEVHAARRVRVRFNPKDTTLRVQKQIVSKDNPLLEPVEKEYMKEDYHRRNERRRADLILIANAIFSFKSDNNYQIPSVIKLTPREICRTGVDTQVCAAEGLVDISSFTHTYLEKLPFDPNLPDNGKSTGYTVHKDSRNKIHYTALHTEQLLTQIKMNR